MVEGRVEVAREAEESDLEVQDQEDLGVGEDVERQGREGRGGHTALSISRRSKGTPGPLLTRHGHDWYTKSRPYWLQQRYRGRVRPRRPQLRRIS